MTGTCGSPLWPWAAGAAATVRARVVVVGRPGRKAKASRSVSATPKIFLARNSFERERGIKILLAETAEGLTTEARRTGFAAPSAKPRPGRKGRHVRGGPPAWGEKTFMAASDFGEVRRKPAPQARSGTNAKDELEGNRGKLYSR